MWGSESNTTTATIHDAFFTNAADMLKAKAALRESYAKAVNASSVKATLDEMKARGLPQELYDKYLNEAIDIGLIPVPGRSVVGGKVLTENDILKSSDILTPIPRGFSNNKSWYGIG